MKKSSVAFLSALFLLFAVNTPLFAQSSEESAGRAAEQAGKLREALVQYVAALQKAPEGSTDDQRVREAIIKLVQKLSPPPAIPEEARRFSIRGQTWIKEAKSPSDFEEAAKEFARAVRVAPWWADGYINQGVALEKAGKFSEAIRSLKLYLLAAPAAPDADKVKDQIYALEVRQEKAGKEAIAKKEQDRSQDFVRSIAGSWEARISVQEEGRPSNRLRYAAKVQGNSLEMTISASFDPYHKDWRVPSAQAPWHNFRGTVDGPAISGTVTIDYSGTYQGGRVVSAPFSGTISPDGQSIHVSYTIAEPCCGWRFGGPGTKFGDPARGGGFREVTHSAEFRHQ